MIIETSPLKDFLMDCKYSLAAKVQNNLTPIYIPGASSALSNQVRKTCRTESFKPLPAQQECINALVTGFEKYRCLALIGDMGTGKTAMSSLVAKCLPFIFKRPARVLITCPPTLPSTWMEELERLFGDNAKIIDATGPNALSLFVKLRKAPRMPAKPEFWISGFNRMKTSSPWEQKHSIQRKIEEVQGTDAGGYTYTAYERNEYHICPHCSHDLKQLMEHDGDRVCCPKCRQPLWSMVTREDVKPNPAVMLEQLGSGVKSVYKGVYAPVLYIKKYLRRHFDLVVVDEVQKTKGASTIQGAMLGQLAGAINKTLVLTGTLSGGICTDVFYLIHRAFALNMSKEERRLYLPHYSSALEFVQRYGSWEKTFTHKEGDKLTGRASREYEKIKEIPGISPELLRQFLIEYCVFLRITDIASAMVPYKEYLHFCGLDEQVKDELARFTTQAKIAAMNHMLQQDKDMRPMGQLIPTLLAWPDQPQQVAEITNRNREVVASAPALDVPLTHKDRELIRLVKDATTRGRKSLIYVEYTGKWSCAVHIAEIMEDAGLRPLVLTPAVPTRRRLQWIRDKMGTGSYDCMITNPRLVETGMNLLEFPTILYYQTPYSIFVLRQSSRRSWRMGQKHNVEVHFLINRGTLQESAMTYIANKLEQSLVLEGDLSQGGLIDLSNSATSLNIAMARALQGDLEQGSLEEAFQNWRSAEEASWQQAAEELAVDAYDDEEDMIEEAVATPSKPVKTVTGPWNAVTPIQKAEKDSGLRTKKMIGKLFGFRSDHLEGTIRNKSFTLNRMEDGSFLVAYGDSVVAWNGPQEPLKIKTRSYLVTEDSCLPGTYCYTVYSTAA